MQLENAIYNPLRQISEPHRMQSLSSQNNVQEIQEQGSRANFMDDAPSSAIITCHSGGWFFPHCFF